MKALIQRVTESRVVVDGRPVGEIDRGLLVFLGIDKHDSELHADKLLGKILNYRVFSDQEGKMNLSVRDIQGGVLLVSQFTLSADTGKGLRPSFSSAAAPADAERIYGYFLSQLRNLHAKTASGCFGADMQVSLINDGPVTFWLES